MSDQCVKVAIRCRPPSEKEIKNGEDSCVEMIEDYNSDGNEQGQCTLTDPSGAEQPVKFAFDIVFGLSVAQTTVYNSLGVAALAKTFEGYNGTIFAYGQTGSGKSFCMQGGPGDLRGITPRINEDLFGKIVELTTETPTRKFLVMCSYFEIYNEIIFDLLNPVADRAKLGGGLQIKEHPVMGIYVKDLQEVVAPDAEKLEGLLESGQKNRAVSATQMNATSSRSHSIFTIKVHQKDDTDKSRNVFAKLNLVDLAGSERQKGTGATGQTLKEGANINKSLSALGNVINALVECANGKKVFIPYRNSKLTRVLQESLGGNSLCTMLATLSPAACNYEETLSTLRYANRAKAIKVSATKNEEASQISRLQAEVAELKKKLMAQGGSGGGGGGGPGVGMTQEEREQYQSGFVQKIKDMEAMINSNWDEKKKVSEEHERRMANLKAESDRAAQAVESERLKRLKMLEEKNDPELSIRGLVDLVAALPKMESPPPVLSGLPRTWLKGWSSLAQVADDINEHRSMVLVVKTAFDEDIRLWGEGLEANELGMSFTGLQRCLPKLGNVQRECEAMLKLEEKGLQQGYELAESLQKAMQDITPGRCVHMFKGLVTADANDEALGAEQEAAFAAAQANVAEIGRIVTLIDGQLKAKLESLQLASSFQMKDSCELILRNLQVPNPDGAPNPEALQESGQALQGIVQDGGSSAKPLKEYTAADADDSIQNTELILGHILRWELLCGGKMKKTAAELLARPPPKFVHDVAVMVKANTGFPKELNNEWLDARQQKIDNLQIIATSVSEALNVTVDFDPEMVLKGKEVPKTMRILQLLAIAAAKQMPDAPSRNSNGLTRARDLPRILDAMQRCVKAARESVDSRRQDKGNANSALEERLTQMQRQLEEEVKTRLSEEELTLSVQRQLREAQADLRKLTTQKDLDQEQQLTVEQEKAELQRQAEELASSGSPEEMTEDSVMKLLAAQIAEVAKALEQDSAEVNEMRQRQAELERGRKDLDTTCANLSMELARQKKKLEEQEKLVGQTPEAQQAILQAAEQKLTIRAETLEEKGKTMVEAAEEKRQIVSEARAVVQELKAKTDDLEVQVNIVQEERDALRDAMEQLWKSKTIVEEDLESVSQGYIGLTERMNEMQDEKQNLEEMIENVENERARLQNVNNNGY